MKKLILFIIILAMVMLAACSSDDDETSERREKSDNKVTEIETDNRDEEKEDRDNKDNTDKSSEDDLPSVSMIKGLWDEYTAEGGTKHIAIDSDGSFELIDYRTDEVIKGTITIRKTGDEGNPYIFCFINDKGKTWSEFNWSEPDDNGMINQLTSDSSSSIFLRPDDDEPGDEDYDEDDEDEDDEENEDDSYFCDENGNPMVYNENGDFSQSVHIPEGYSIIPELTTKTLLVFSNDEDTSLKIEVRITDDREERWGYIKEEGEYRVIEHYPAYVLDEGFSGSYEYTLGYCLYGPVYLYANDGDEDFSNMVYASLMDGQWMQIDISGSSQPIDWYKDLFVYMHYGKDGGSAFETSYADPEPDPDTAYNRDYTLNTETGKRELKDNDGNVVAEFNLPEGFYFSDIDSSENQLWYHSEDGNSFCISCESELWRKDLLETGTEIKIGNCTAFTEGDDKDTLIYLGDDNDHYVFLAVSYNPDYVPCYNRVIYREAGNGKWISIYTRYTWLDSDINNTDEALQKIIEAIDLHNALFH